MRFSTPVISKRTLLLYACQTRANTISSLGCLRVCGLPVSFQEKSKGLFVDSSIAITHSSTVYLLFIFDALFKNYTEAINCFVKTFWVFATGISVFYPAKILFLVISLQFYLMPDCKITPNTPESALNPVHIDFRFTFSRPTMRA